MRWQAATATRAAAARLTVLFVVGALAWAGLTQSDDRFCAAAASGWAFHFPYLPNSH